MKAQAATGRADCGGLPADDSSPYMSPAFARTLRLNDIQWTAKQIQISWGVDDLSFETAIRYDTVDFGELQKLYSRDLVEWLVFHVAMFEINKGVSFGPNVLHVADRWQRYLTEDLCQLWRTVTRRVWAQWRYEHDLPRYEGPTVAPTATESSKFSLRLPVQPADSLWFCGGGKDSLLAAHVLDKVGVAYDALAYSRSIYGPVDHQLDLIEKVVDSSDAQARHHMYISDTATDLPLQSVSPEYEVRSVNAGETPASLFASLPIALAHGHRNLILGHERSANVGNLVWDATGEDVNHQWGKSLEAERLLGDYIQEHLTTDISYFSILQPVHDALIFSSLRELSSSVPRAHSCNITKPWCKRCPKCAYVWICYKAWLPWDPTDQAFGGSNLLDDPFNEVWYRQMLGLEEHTPFECIGQIDEARLAFAMANARGLSGGFMKLIEDIYPIDSLDILSRYLKVEPRDHRIPEFLARSVIEYFQIRASEAYRFATDVLTSSPAS